MMMMTTTTTNKQMIDCKVSALQFKDVSIGGELDLDLVNVDILTSSLA